MKYDWLKLECEFTTHKRYAAVSRREFAALKKIPYNNNYNKHTKAWPDIRAAKRRQKDNKIEEKVTASEIADAVALNRRHLDLYDKTLKIAETILDEQMGKSVDMFGNVHETEVYNANKLKTIVQTLDVAQKGQRLAISSKEDSPDSLVDSAIGSVLELLRGRQLKEGECGD